MALTVSQPILFFVLFSAMGVCMLVILVYMTFIFIQRQRSLKISSPAVTRELHPYAWKTRLSADGDK